MITVTMVRKLKDNNGKIYGYIIRDNYGKEAGIYTDDLKQNIRNGACTVTNLTLTSDNRLVEKKITHKDILIEKPAPVNKVNSTETKRLIPSICGVQIKGLKTAIGREGEYYSANVYLYGKMLGQWSQSPYGAIVDDFMFRESLLKPSLDRYRIIKDNTSISMETFMVDLVILTEYYKEFQKMIKNGTGTAMTIVSDSINYRYCIVRHRGLNKEVNAGIEKLKLDIEKGGFGVKVIHFNSENDFAID